MRRETDEVESRGRLIGTREIKFLNKKVTLHQYIVSRFRFSMGEGVSGIWVKVARLKEL